MLLELIQLVPTILAPRRTAQRRARLTREQAAVRRIPPSHKARSGQQTWRIVKGEDSALPTIARLHPFGLYLGRVKEIWSKERGFDWSREEGFPVGENTLARMFPDGLTAARRQEKGGELWWLN